MHFRYLPYHVAYRLDMRNLWRGEVTLKRHLPQEQGTYALHEHIVKIIENSESEETAVSSVLKSKSFPLVHHSDTQSQEESSLQPVRKHLRPLTNPSSPEHYRQQREEMTSIVGTYQHESNENLDEYFKAVGMLKATKNECHLLYDGSKSKYDV